MTRLYLIRHGETHWNLDSRYQGHSDIELTDKGREQAQKLSGYLIKKGVKIDAIYASDLSRAFETASIIAHPQGIAVNINKDFREMNFGIWEGLTFKEIQKQYQELAKQWLKSPETLEIPSGESFIKVKERANKALQDILEKSQLQNFCIVSHGGTLRAIICNLLDLPLTKMWQFKMDNTSLTIFDFFRDKAVLNLYNSTAHLEDGH